MIESGSSIGVFMTCPKKYEFSYEKRLESMVYPQALGYGSMIHSWVESIVGRDRRNAAHQCLEEWSKKYKSQDDQQQIGVDFMTSQHVVNLWERYWSNDAHPFGNNHLDFQESEFEWSYDLPSVAGEPSDYRHVGKSDGVVLHKKYGKVFLYELKTAADRQRDTYIHHLQVDKQISSNIIALRARGIQVDGVIYDVIWKPAISRLKNRKTKPDETLQEFSSRLIETMRLEPKDYFERHIVFRNDKDIADYSIDLRQQFDAIERAKTSKAFYRNSGACDDFGRLCPYFSLCMEGKEEMEAMFNKRDLRFPELGKEIQDV